MNATVCVTAASKSGASKSGALGKRAPKMWSLVRTHVQLRNTWLRSRRSFFRPRLVRRRSNATTTSADDRRLSHHGNLLICQHRSGGAIGEAFTRHSLRPSRYFERTNCTARAWIAPPHRACASANFGRYVPPWPFEPEIDHQILIWWRGNSALLKPEQKAKGDTHDVRRRQQAGRSGSHAWRIT